MTASVSPYVAGHQPIPGIVKHTGSHDVIDQPASSPMRPINRDQETHVFKFAHPAKSGVWHNAIEVWATGGIPTSFGRQSYYVGPHRLGFEPYGTTMRPACPASRPYALEFTQAARSGGVISDVNGGEKSWRWAVEKCGALEWRIGC